MSLHLTRGFSTRARPCAGGPPLVRRRIPRRESAVVAFARQPRSWCLQALPLVRAACVPLLPTLTSLKATYSPKHGITPYARNSCKGVRSDSCLALAHPAFPGSLFVMLDPSTPRRRRRFKDFQVQRFKVTRSP